MTYTPPEQRDRHDVDHQRDVGEQQREHQRAGEHRPGRVDEHPGDDVERGERLAGATVVATLEELGDRRDLRLQVDRQDQHREEEQDERRHPLVVPDRDALVVAGPGQPDVERPGEVGGDQREPDHGPGHPTSGQEVALGVLLLATDPEADTEDADDVGADDGEVDRGQVEVGHRGPPGSGHAPGGRAPPELRGRLTQPCGRRPRGTGPQDGGPRPVGYGEVWPTAGVSRRGTDAPTAAGVGRKDPSNVPRATDTACSGLGRSR
jgi:hypothetical protein